MDETSIVTGPSAAGVDLTGRSALVTGAASGIGRACAERLARVGASVTVLDLDGDAARRVAGEIGGEAQQADLSDSGVLDGLEVDADRKSTRLNSSHANISYAVFCLKKKKT